MPTAVTTSEKELRARLELANRLGALAAGARDLAELFRALHDETARVMDATVFLFALYDEASATVQVVRQMDRGVEYPGGTFPLGKGFTSEVIRTGAPMLVRRWSAEGPAVHLIYGTEAGELVTPQSLVVGQPLEQQRLEQWPATAREVAAALLPLIAALRSGTSVAEEEVELRSGQRRVLSLAASALRSARGTPQGGVVVLRDITGQRDLERLREDIFNMAWHDVKTPLAVVRGHAELLHRRLSSGERDRKDLEADAASIVTHVDRLAELLTTLFDVSCLEAGLLSILRWRTDLGVLAREVTESIRSTARHQIKVLSDQDVVGEWDERRLRQALMNLLSNALKYSPEGSTVTVSVAAGARSATVRVRDEGIGLDGTELTQLFRRGYRAEPARNVAGGGLGLYFSNGIVAAHGGRMWAESLGHGQGSTFCFTLPLREERSAYRPAVAHA